MRRSNPLTGIIIAVVVIIVIFGAVLLFPSLSSNNSSNNSNSSDVQATTAADLAQMRAALNPRFADWQKQNDGLVHHMPASDAGFKASDNTKEVVYGYCTGGTFYAYVLESSKPENAGADTEGYAYTPGSSVTACIPAGWSVVSSDTADKDWAFVTLNTLNATNTAPTVAPATTN
jgi:hypothetical protein